MSYYIVSNSFLQNTLVIQITRNEKGEHVPIDIAQVKVKVALH